MVYDKQKTSAEWALENLNNSIEQYYKALKKDEERLLKESRTLLSKYAPTISQDACGIYAIQVDDKILYVGQSKWITDRVLSHIFEMTNCLKKVLLDEYVEKKYKILASAVLTGHKIEFITLCECNKDKEELDEKEIYYINLYNAPLNTYRPKRHKTPDTLEEALAT